ncbi:hypothetical protein H4R99_008239 [Coemansia sp. RSA 1722]|nr:hypothetical protein LPJ57_010328 [Coemansia sp. RSA 486]KAJ2587183.1 hypothetical protein H4R99_008239 [Coemansia sp. RSA 1722]
MSAVNAAWTPETELALFNSMVGLRPVGIHRHFRMVNIYMRFLSLLGGTVEISIDDIKARLDKLFDIQLLEKIEEEDDADDAENGSQHNDKDDGNISSDSQKESVDGESLKLAGPKSKKEQSMARRRLAPRKSRRTRVGYRGQGNSSSEDGDESNEDGNSDSDEESADAAKEDRKVSAANHQLSRSDRSTASGLVAEIDASDPQFWQKPESEFALPWSDFGILMIERAGVGVADEHDELERATASGASAMSTPKTTTPAPETEPQSEAEAEDEVEDKQDATHDDRSEAGSSERAEAQSEAEPEPEPKLSDEPVTPVQRKRRGRSSTPVPRGRAKATRSTTASARKRQKGR